MVKSQVTPLTKIHPGQGSCLPLPRDVLLSTALGNHVPPACLGIRILLALWMWRLVSLFQLLCCAPQCPNPSQRARRSTVAFLRAGRSRRSWLFFPWQCAGACSLQELGQCVHWPQAQRTLGSAWFSVQLWENSLACPLLFTFFLPFTQT